MSSVAILHPYWVQGITVFCIIDLSVGDLLSLFMTVCSYFFISLH